MNSYVFYQLAEAEMVKEAKVWRKVKNLFQREDPMLDVPTFRAQGVHKEADPFATLEGGVFKDIADESEMRRRGVSRIRWVTGEGKGYGKTPSGLQSMRRGNWAVLDMKPSEVIGEPHRGGTPIIATRQLVKNDPEFVDRTVNELEQFAHHIGRTVDPAEKERAREVLSQMLRDRGREETIRNVGVGAGVAGLGAAGLVAGKVMKSRAARRQLRRRMAIGAGVGGGALTGGAVLHQREHVG